MTMPPTFSEKTRLLVKHVEELMQAGQKLVPETRGTDGHELGSLMAGLNHLGLAADQFNCAAAEGEEPLAPGG